jgi:hypothetical protein
MQEGCDGRYGEESATGGRNKARCAWPLVDAGCLWPGPGVCSFLLFYYFILLFLISLLPTVCHSSPLFVPFQRKTTSMHSRAERRNSAICVLPFPPPIAPAIRLHAPACFAFVSCTLGGKAREGGDLGGGRFGACAWRDASFESYLFGSIRTYEVCTEYHDDAASDGARSHPHVFVSHNLVCRVFIADSIVSCRAVHCYYPVILDP